MTLPNQYPSNTRCGSHVTASLKELGNRTGVDGRKNSNVLSYLCTMVRTLRMYNAGLLNLGVNQSILTMQQQLHLKFYSDHTITSECGRVVSLKISPPLCGWACIYLPSVHLVQYCQYNKRHKSLLYMTGVLSGTTTTRLVDKGIFKQNGH